MPFFTNDTDLQNFINAKFIANGIEDITGPDANKALIGLLEAIYRNSKDFEDTTVTGTINGVNDMFTTTKNFVSGSVKLYRNGQRLFRNQDFLEVLPNKVQFYFPPKTGSRLIAEYKETL